MKPRRKLTIILAALALALTVAVLTLIAGCGTEKNDPEPTEAPTGETVNVPTAEPEETAEVTPEETQADATPADGPTEEITEIPTEVLTDMPVETATGIPTDALTDEPSAGPSETPGLTDQPGTSVPTATPTAPPASTATAVRPTATPTATPGPTPTQDPGRAPDSSVDVLFTAGDILKYFTGPNDVKAEVFDDPDYGNTVRLSTTKKTNDPFISFSYESYMTAYKLTAVSADEYKYVVLKFRQENCSNSNFEIFYYSGSRYGAAAGYSRSTVFDNSDTDWQYVIFDLSSVSGWTGKVHGFRFDYMFSANAAGESIVLGELIFAKTLNDVADFIGGTGEDLHALSEADQKKAEKLINGATDVAPAISNTKQTAAHEDSDIDLWFNHSYVKTPESSTTSSGMYSYQIRLAKNEIEGVQLLLATKKAKSGLTLELTPFTDSSGNVLKSVVCEGYYFDDIEGQSIVDPIPELEDAFDLKAGKSKTFLIKVYTDKTTKAGQYSATVSVKDSSGNEVKKAEVYAYVWNFALPDASNCKILAGLDWWNIYSSNAPWLYNGDDSETYVRYYEYLLENKVNAYDLPYMNMSDDNPFTDPRIEKYLNDPRVQCFNPVGFSKFTSARVQYAYNYLSKNAEWLKKAYFYPVDEPKNKSELDNLVSCCNVIKSVFGSNYKLIAPMHINGLLSSNPITDYFSYVSGVVNIWCPHSYFFNTLADYKNNPTLMFWYYTAVLENNLGSFVDRMAAEQAGGDEVWWYVTRFPHHPEITLSIDDQEIEHRLMFWQQKLYNVDGFLYYDVNDWSKAGNWTSKHETDNSYPYNVYGNGVLVYNGFKDSNGDPYISREHYDEVADKSYYAYPVGTLRLESVRDGAEDYDYFTILDELYGEGTSDLIIKQITTSMGNYKTDDALFNELRIAVGNLIAAKS